MYDDLFLALLIFICAALYSTVGHAGASGYLAAMALFGLAPEVMRPAALVLNILVATIATIRFARAGCFVWRTFLPFAVLSVPFAFVGGTITLPNPIYHRLVGLVLLYAAVRLFLQAAASKSPDTRVLPPVVGLPLGGAIGLLSGLTGVGGGIFLSPLILLMRWADPRQTAGVSAAFILVNSIAGLAAQYTAIKAIPASVGYWVVAAVVGGAIGSHIGARKLAGPALRRWLACVLVVAAMKMLVS